MSWAALPRSAPLIPPRWLAAGLMLFFLLLSAQYSAKVLQSERENRSAILRWRNQLFDLSAGIDIWQAHNYPNPPIMALMLSPLAELPPLAMALVWFYLKVGMVLLAYRLVFRLIETPDQPFPPWTKALVVILSLRPIMSDLTHGNVNILILFLMVWALYLFTRGRDVRAGLVMGLAVACKLTPALFIPYFAWKRAWRTLAACTAGMLLFLILVPGLFLGFRDNAHYLRHWFDNMVVPYAVRDEVWTEHSNQSLPALAQRLLTDSPSFVTGDDRDPIPLEYHNFVELPRELVRWLIKGCMLLFAGLVMWTCRTMTDRRRDWRLSAEFAVIVLGMLLFSERTWKHHCVTLLLPFAVLTYVLARPTAGATWAAHRPRKRFIIAALCGAVLCMLSTGTGFADGLDRVGKLAQTYGAYAWAHLLLLAALAALLRWRCDRFLSVPCARNHGVVMPAQINEAVVVSGRIEIADQASNQANTSETIDPCTSGSGRPVRSTSVVSGSIPNR